MDDSVQEQVLNYVFQDSNSTYPFAVAFFMFRAGQHTIAIDYLRASPNPEVQRFGEQYRKWLSDYGQCVPTSSITQFYQDCEKLIPTVKDMYKSALTYIMIGCQYTPLN